MTDKEKQDIIKKYKDISKNLLLEYIDKIEKNIYSAVKEGLDEKGIYNALLHRSLSSEFDESMDCVLIGVTEILHNKYGEYCFDKVLKQIVRYNENEKTILNLASNYKCYLNGKEIPIDAKLIYCNDGREIYIKLSYNKTLEGILKRDNILTVYNIGRDIDTPRFLNHYGISQFISFILDTEVAALVPETGKFECRFCGNPKEIYYFEELPTANEVLCKRKETH